MYPAIAISAFRVQANFRTQLWVMMFGGMLNVVARVSIWQSVFQGRDTVSDVGLAQMVTYAILGTALLSTWDASQMVREIGADIRSGNVVTQLMRPYSYPASLFARQFGSRMFEMLAIGLPVIVVMGAVYGLQPPASFGHGVLFLLSVALSLYILFALATMVGLIGFWVMDMLALDWFLRGTLALLSGGMVPLWFYPQAVADVARYLPFSWIGFYPMTIYLGQTNLAASAISFLFGCCWAAILTGIVGLIWRFACRRMVVQGG